MEKAYQTTSNFSATPTSSVFGRSQSKFEFKNKFTVARRHNSHIRTEDVMRWSGNNFYRTSYNDMTSKVSEQRMALMTCVQSPVKNKNTVLPGYQGHLPKIGYDNTLIGKRFTEQAREVFDENLDGNTKFGMSSAK